MTDRSFFPLNDLRDLMDPEFANNRKINCIKHIRAITGEGLKEAKDFFEQEWLPFVNGDRKSIKRVTDTPEFDALVQQVQQLAQEVNNLKAAQTKQTAKGIFNDG